MDPWIVIPRRTLSLAAEILDPHLLKLDNRRLAGMRPFDIRSSLLTSFIRASPNVYSDVAFEFPINWF
jgi:hypothetical protein